MKGRNGMCRFISFQRLFSYCRIGGVYTRKVSMLITMRACEFFFIIIVKFRVMQIFASKDYF